MANQVAYIPEKVIQDQLAVLSSPAAIALYHYYCFKRNKKTGGWTCPKELVLSEIKGLSEPSYFRAKAKLKKEGWIETQGDFVRPVYGFETIKNDSADGLKNDSATIKNESRTLKNDSAAIKNESPTIKNDSAPYKEETANLNNQFNNKSTTEEEEGETSASAAAGRRSDGLRDGDKDDPRASELNGEKSSAITKKTWEAENTRRDLETPEWLRHLQQLPECKNIRVKQLWEKMLRWCAENKKQANRARFLNWLWDEIGDVPVHIDEEELRQNEIVRGDQSPKNSKQRRDEYAIAHFNASQRNRDQVERRRAELLRKRDADDR